MLKFLKKITNISRRQRLTYRKRANLSLDHLDRLESRSVPAVTAFFSPSMGLLSIYGDTLDNTIEVSRDAAGGILVNGGSVYVSGCSPTVANTLDVRIMGQEGNDTLTLDETNGALPAARLVGGDGDDTLTGGSAADQIFGEAGNDTLLGKGGADLLNGGADNDTLTGGDADDQAFGESGDDHMIWNPGDDTDLNEGGDGNDTIEVNGGAAAESFTVTANGARVRFDRVNPAPFAIDIGTSENIILNANGGDDTFSATGNLAALIKITVDGGAGNDTLLGSNGIDLLRGGDGNDFIDGQQGNDVAFMGAGDDTFQWDPGDGSDTLEGQDGQDTMIFNGSAGNEIFDLSANGGRLLFFRNLGNITMDTDDVEQIDLNALGGTDTVTVNDMSGTDLVEMNVNLAGTIGGTTGDAAADVAIVNGTNGNDLIDVVGAGTSVSVLGLSTFVNISNSEGANDSLVINALGGNDSVTATTLPAGIIKLTVDGGAGNDTLLGSQGIDVFLGGDGDDFIFGDNGNDTALMGAGDDSFQWDPGDGSDTIEGQDGSDTMLFNGSNAAEQIDISANGGRVRFFRDVATVTMDMDDVEKIDFRALGGADNVVIGDLSGTDMTQIGLDLRGPAGGGDGAADTITANGTNGDDVFGAAGDAGGVNVFGLQAAVNILFQEQANDRLTLNALGGDDVVNASSLEADGIQLIMNGGLGEDVMIGSQGNDLFNGGDGNDTALMGAGDDTFVWNPGDDNDTLEGQAGLDTMLFNGANVAEIIDIFANGGRVLFIRNIANVAMDLNDVDAIDFNALGGADRIAVRDLSGTDVTEINLNLAVGGAGDGQPDTVIVDGTNAADQIEVLPQNGGVAVVGLAATVNITQLEAADVLTINGLAGNDSITLNETNGALPAARLVGGDGDDTLTGGSAADQIFGDSGNDHLFGKGGADLLFGGDDNDFLTGGDADDQAFGEAGNDRMIWNPGDDTDLNEGGDGTDTVEVNGGGAAESFTVTANGTRVRFDRVNPAPFAIDIGTSENIVVSANGGDDTFSATGNLAALIKITVDGGAGNDTLLGSNGIDVMLGGDGNDFIDGQQGNDVAFMGAGNDTFQWDPGDGSDTIEGQDGQDTMLFNGSAGNEIFDLSANGGRLLFFRNLGNITMDTDDVEAVTVNALGGADAVTVGNLRNTDVKNVNLNLAGTIGGTTGDAQLDRVILNGTDGTDLVAVLGVGGGISVMGLPAFVRMTGVEATDALTINTLGGNDIVLAIPLSTPVALTIDGGDGNDLLLGSNGNDVLIGGDGADSLMGRGGNDNLDGGLGYDALNGGDGTDTLINGEINTDLP